MTNSDLSDLNGRVSKKPIYDSNGVKSNIREGEGNEVREEERKQQEDNEIVDSNGTKVDSLSQFLRNDLDKREIDSKRNSHI